MLLNLAYMHLRSRLEHGEKCSRKKCEDGCGFVAFDEWLAAPLTAADMAEDERLRGRAAAILAGDI